MKKFNTLFLFLFLPLIFSSCSTSKEYAIDWTEIRNELQPMINMLEMGLYTDFLNTYVDPRLVHLQGGASSMLADFDATKRSELLTTLKQAKEIQPFIDTEKKIATFDGENFIRPLAFQKIGDRWYLINNANQIEGN